MASLGKKNGIYHVRFRFGGRSYKRSLVTADAKEAEYLLCRVKQRLHELSEIQGVQFAGSDIDAYILGQGTMPPIVLESESPQAKSGTDVVELDTSAGDNTMSYTALCERYLTTQEHRLAETYVASQRTHLGHLGTFLVERAQQSCGGITGADLDKFLDMRLGKRHRNTVIRERNTLIQFFRWAQTKGHIAASPAARLETISPGPQLPQFRTKSEIEELLARGGIEPEKAWECLYLDYSEIATLLKLVRSKAQHPVNFLLHAIPAYTGMRRGEVLRLTWLDVDLDKGWLIARSRKQSRAQQETPRQIELNPELTAELQRWKESQRDGQHVVCDPNTLEPLSGNIATRLFWRPLRKTEWCLSGRKGQFKIGFHTYRHSFASNLAASGIDARIIDALMGHTTEAMRRRYLHLFPSNRRAAIDSFSLRETGDDQPAAA